jgi:DNA polymerase-1
VKGIGEKTAKDLLREAGSLCELIDHPEKIKSERLRKMITEGRDSIILSKTLATIDTDLPLELDSTDLLLKEPDWQKLLDLFTEFEFRNFIRLVPNQGHRQRGEYRTVSTRAELEEFFR